MAGSARPTRRTLTVALVVAALGVPGLGALAGCSLLAEDFEPYGEEAVVARAAATDEVTALADRLAGAGKVLGRARADGCTTGQDNWKRRDTYSHECSVVESRLVLVTTDSESVADGLTAADSLLRDLGCTPSSWGGLERVRDEYWDAANPQVRQHGAAGLPGVTYECAAGPRVDVRPSSAGGAGTDPGAGLRSAFFDDELSADPYTTEELDALAASGAELALVLTVSDVYYRTRF